MKAADKKSEICSDEQIWWDNAHMTTLSLAQCVGEVWAWLPPPGMQLCVFWTLHSLTQDSLLVYLQKCWWNTPWTDEVNVRRFVFHTCSFLPNVHISPAPSDSCGFWIQLTDSSCGLWLCLNLRSLESTWRRFWMYFFVYVQCIWSWSFGSSSLSDCVYLSISLDYMKHMKVFLDSE